MEGNQAGTSLDSLIASFHKRIGELQELVIAQNMYPVSSIPDLSAIDTALSSMELQVQSIKDGLREETKAIPKAKVRRLELALLKRWLRKGLKPVDHSLVSDVTQFDPYVVISIIAETILG